MSFTYKDQLPVIASQSTIEAKLASQSQQFDYTSRNSLVNQQSLQQQQKDHQFYTSAKSVGTNVIVAVINESYQVVQQPPPHPLEESSQLSQRVLILNYINDNSLDCLRKMHAKKLNLNYLEEFSHVEIDKVISPLILACHLGRQEIVKYLLQNESINAGLLSEPKKESPLSVACASGFYELVDYLLRKREKLNVSVNNKNSSGHTPFFSCFAQLNVEDGVHSFETRRLCLKLADLLLDYDSNIDEIIDNNKGFTTLMYFCAIKRLMNPKEIESNIIILRYLLERGADPCLLSKKGKTLQDLLSRHPNKSVVSELIRTTQPKRTVKRDDLATSKCTATGSGGGETQPKSERLKTNSNSNSNQQTIPSRFNLDTVACDIELNSPPRPKACCNFFSFFK